MHKALSIFGVANQMSCPLRLGGWSPKSIRQTPPFLNGSGARAPMSQAASSPRLGLVADERERARVAFERDGLGDLVCRAAGHERRQWTQLPASA